jgi:very-short-patch-repair endonuclease
MSGRLISKNVNKYKIKWNKPSRSKLQFNVKQFLKPHWKHQVCFEEFPVYGTRMSVDLINFTKKIAIEVNGPQHKEFNKFFHGNSKAKYLSSIKRDWEKTEWLETNGFELVEIEYDEVKDLSVSFIKNKFGISII